MIDLRSIEAFATRQQPQGLSAPGTAVRREGYRQAGLERPARRPAVPAGGAERGGARAQPRVDGGFHAGHRRAARPARQDDDGAAALRAADRSRRVGHHVRHGAAGEPGRARRPAAHHPRQPARRCARTSLQAMHLRERNAGPRTALPRRFDRAVAADRGRCASAQRADASVDGAAGNGRHRRSHRLPHRRRGDALARAIAASRSVRLSGVECFEGLSVTGDSAADRIVVER